MSKVRDLLHFGAQKKLPMILQTEVAECGLACMAMVASYHGHQVDLNTLRREYPFSLRGIDLNQMIQLGEQLGLSARPLKLELEELCQLQTPCVLHWDLNHFVVLQSIKGQKVTIYDPAKGVRQFTLEQVSQHFTGIALELMPNETFKKINKTESLPLSFFWRQAKGLKATLGKLLLLSLALQALSLVAPFYMQWVVDEAIVSHDMSLLLVLSLGFLLLGVIQTLLTAFRSFVLLFVNNLMSIQMASQLFKHLVRLPLAYFEKRHIGDIVSRFGALGRIRELLTNGVVEVIVDGLMAVTTLGMMFLYSALLAVAVVITVLIYALFRWYWFMPLRQLTEESIVSSAKESSTFMETVRAIQSIKIFNQETARENIWQNRYADMLNAGIQLTRANIFYSAMNGLLFTLENIIVVYLAAQMAIHQQFSIGMIFAFMSYKGQFESRASALIQKWIEMKMLSLHLDRLSDIALNDAENVTRTKPERAPLTGLIQVKGLSYAYPGSLPVFQNIQMDIQPGESVAIIGRSGCGKTTLLKVLMGLFEADGEILVDGMPLAQYGIPEYRHQVASVMQSDALLAGSLAENISFFDQNMDLEQVQRCAELAAIHQDILKMPMGYNTLIGDMGTSLSGGQQQRVLLARALYRAPKILFLDEATSHLDVTLEQTVTAAIKQLAMTRIIVAHRPETIAAADRVLCLENGKLTEVGYKNNQSSTEIE